MIIIIQSTDDFLVYISWWPYRHLTTIGPFFSFLKAVLKSTFRIVGTPTIACVIYCYVYAGGRMTTQISYRIPSQDCFVLQLGGWRIFPLQALWWLTTSQPGNKPLCIGYTHIFSVRFRKHHVVNYHLLNAGGGFFIFAQGRTLAPAATSSTDMLSTTYKKSALKQGEEEREEDEEEKREEISRRRL